jgi:putative FmdB family regulatory protein
MPIYEYTSQVCGRLTSVFVKSMNSDIDAACRHCGSARLSRHLRHAHHHKSEATISPGTALGKRVEDCRPAPDRPLGRATPQEMGEELPDQTRKMIDAAREGELPPPLTD